MYLIAGLGNPTKKYEHTRHNVGFDTLDKVAEKFDIKLNEKKHKAELGRGFIGTEKVILAKPQTFMNLSGDSIRAICGYNNIPADHIIIIYDDTDLAEGRMRIREKGSAGGHNGIKSIIERLGTDAFNRIRIGIGAREEGTDLADYVLSKPHGESRKLLEGTMEDVPEAVELIIKEGIQAAMNRFNRKEKVRTEEQA